MNKLPELTPELTHLLRQLDRKKAGFKEKLTELDNKGSRLSRNTNLKDLGLMFALYFNRTNFDDRRPGSIFSDFAYKMDIPYALREADFINESADMNIWQLIYQGEELDKIDMRIENTVTGLITGYGERQGSIMVQWPLEGRTDFTADFTINHLLYELYHSPFASDVLSIISMFQTLHQRVNLNNERRVINIGDNIGVNETLLQFVPVVTKVLKAKPSDVPTITASELEALQIQTINVIFTSSRINYRTKLQVKVEKPFASRVIELMDKPLNRGRVDIDKMYIAMALLNMTLASRELIGSVCKNMSEVGLRINLLNQINSIAKYSPFLKTAGVNETRLSPLDIWSQILSDDDIIQALAFMHYAQDTTAFIFTKTNPLKAREEAFDANFEVDTLATKLAFHGLPLQFFGLTPNRDSLRRFINEVQIDAQDSIETTILSTMSTVQAIRGTIKLQEKPMLAAYIKFADKIFDIWMDPENEDGKEFCRLINPLNNKEVAKIETSTDNVNTFAELNGLFAKELSNLFGKVVG